ncbi:MAG: hypothetical protein RLZZ515_1388 [Cyanobacteriota bacterium]
MIRGAVGSSVQPATAQPRWDRINSAEVIAHARRIYFHFLECSPSHPDPLGVVIGPLQGRVVFELPVLLPEEQFIALELVRGRSPRGRSSRSPLRG